MIEIGRKGAAAWPARVCLLGEGRWGTAAGAILSENGHQPFFVHHAETAWPRNFDLLCLAIPVQHVRETLRRLPAPMVPVVSLGKGLEVGTGFRVTEIVRDAWGSEAVAALSGPNFAEEILRGLPAATVAASRDEALAAWVQQLFHNRRFRVYRSADLIGVEIGGALKNVYGIAGGLCAGLELGENASASLLTRCLAEMSRLGLCLGGRPETFAGLSGLGDLILTARSRQSRNFLLGYQLAQGISLKEALARAGGVVEGVPTTASVRENPLFREIKKPLAEEIYQILFEGKEIRRSLLDLLEREAAPELG
ncbi:NAD(P)H-dependent glycerol-3-phosphate dehydrogenase [Methylacidimicrobium tartarophylax]|uniref:Glycerol-3-phosphate dehydrogenase [NAD(P)+] n=1 Tax=Methylacidimicrobium tartarophylax TaxID=1041768 RepID=A0A5E6M6U5_9BACT|nr:NAD(P)H-dependent glycerol-3-phosphate dehydrogenase [Methylacidimicrobium tartarophylax]VVM05279.1 glycerol-3-phosphate dehydrogenase (NAD(P)+) [Methylacidimicrobium tartarophylax]